MQTKKEAEQTQQHYDAIIACYPETRQHEPVYKAGAYFMALVLTENSPDKILLLSEVPGDTLHKKDRALNSGMFFDQAIIRLLCK